MMLPSKRLAPSMSCRRRSGTRARAGWHIRASLTDGAPLRSVAREYCIRADNGLNDRLQTVWRRYRERVVWRRMLLI